MIRFRVWDNEEKCYLQGDTGISILPNGSAVWYDGVPVNEDEPGRFEIEFGNQYCFHNDIVQAKTYGGSWSIQQTGRIWNDEVPRDHMNMYVIKDIETSCHDIHTLYWDRPIKGVAILDESTMEFHMAGFTCNDRFYGYEGEEYDIRDIVVIGNVRFDETPFCKKGRESYDYYMKHIIGEKE